MLREWTVNGTVNGTEITTNARTRARVETYIHTDRASMNTMEDQIVLTALLLTSTVTSDYKNQTQYEWTTFITTDKYFKMYLQYCLDWMTILVQVGAEPKHAWQHVLACVKKIDSGTWILSNDLFQAKKAEVTGLAQDTPSQQDRIKVMLDAMKKIIADFEKNNK